MVVHHETRPLQGFELVVGRGGAKMKASTESVAESAAAPSQQPSRTLIPGTDANGFPQLNAPGIAIMEGVRGRAVVSYLTARAQSMTALAEELGKQFRMPILERTGLSARFDFQLEFAPVAPGAAPAAEVGGEINNDAAPNLMTAVQDQLGLKLNPAKIPMDVVVVDRAEQVPAEN
jgi:uncharacterized protein (TIGR03435 family)